MSSKDSPFYHWDRTSPGWLLRKVDEGEAISRAEVIRVVKANPDLELDPVLYKLMVSTISGSLNGKAGREQRPGTAARHFAAIELYRHYLRRIRERKRRARERGHKRARSDMSATDLACALVARQLGYKSEAVVRNLISEAKNRKIRGRYNPDDL